MMLAGDRRCRLLMAMSGSSQVVAQVSRRFVLQTPTNHDSDLVLDSLGDVEQVTGTVTRSTI